MTAAPSTPPAVPGGVMPPDAPRGTGTQLVMSRGGVGEKTPISVAQVSAVAAARPPAKTGHQPARAATAATPPLANTCAAVRCPPPRVNRLPETKKARSRPKPRHPVPHTVAPPTASAATAPPRVSHVTRRTGRAAAGA